MEEIPAPTTHIHNLPNEILLKVFSHLKLEDLLQTAYVCRRWYCLLNHTKDVWRERVFSAAGIKNMTQCVKTTAIMPRFKEVRLIWSHEYRIHIAWPTATVFLPSLGVPKKMPPRGAFSTERLIISVHFSEDYMYCLKWVKKHTLRSIHVGEQCFSFIVHGEKSNEDWYESNLCMVWDCVLHDKNRPLCKIPLRRMKRIHNPKKAVCPSLEHLSVRCQNIFEKDLECLCSLGPIRDLHVMCCGVQSMSFLGNCTAKLEALSVKDYPFWMLFEECDEREEVRILQNLL